MDSSGRRRGPNRENGDRLSKWNRRYRFRQFGHSRGFLHLRNLAYRLDVVEQLLVPRRHSGLASLWIFVERYRGAGIGLRNPATDAPRSEERRGGKERRRG